MELCFVWFIFAMILIKWFSFYVKYKIETRASYLKKTLPEKIFWLPSNSHKKKVLNLPLKFPNHLSPLWKQKCLSLSYFWMCDMMLKLPNFKFFDQYSGKSKRLKSIFFHKKSDLNMQQKICKVKMKSSKLHGTS